MIGWFSNSQKSSEEYVTNRLTTKKKRPPRKPVNQKKINKQYPSSEGAVVVPYTS